ncbi:DNA repair protein RAD52 homolog isoform X2 [Solenopsis invicta]|uniref:DNA repair protein RAD52 homolog isoform X2 n=1 Tax=Solenopsis invicta TaxID=13686 RepID=UPI0005962492|nr:DNA repair protein RAD52 homolog isoform X2 [Solenopsis invicta]
MHNGHDYLSCIKIPAAKQGTMTTDKSEKVGPTSLATDHRDLLLTANKVFGEGKWNHTVISQTLDFVENVGAKCCAGCLSYVKVQVMNGNSHEEVGYYHAEESTKGLAIHMARIGSAVNGLRRALLSFGDKIDKELQQLQRPITSEFQTAKVQKVVARLSDKQLSEISISNKMPLKEKQANDVQTNVSRSSDKQILEKSISNKIPLNEKQVSVPVKSISLSKEINEAEEVCKQLCTQLSPYQSNRVIIRHVPIKNSTGPSVVPAAISSVNKNGQVNMRSFVTIPLKIVENKLDNKPSPNEKTNSSTEKKSDQALSVQEMQRMERKRKQMEKQMEFKKRMMEKDGIKEESIKQEPIKQEVQF